MKMKARFRVTHLQVKRTPKTASTPSQATREAWNRFSPSEEPALPTSQSWSSSLQNRETVSYCCLSYPHLWRFVTAALAKQHIH